MAKHDDSHDLDLVPIFSSSNHDAEMEALAIRGILDSSDIPSVLIGPSSIPSLEFQVQVPKTFLAEAKKVIAEAKAAGPKAAAEAELASEESPS
jgi:hypothetical protein